MTSLNCFQRPSGNSKTTLEKGGKNPPDVTSDHVAKDLLLYFNEFKSIHGAKKEIEKKYDVKNEHGHYCWPADDIKRAWGKTQRMDMKSSRRKDWACVILLQVLKQSICDECKQNAAWEESAVAPENQSITSCTDEDSFLTDVNSDVNSNDSETSDSESVNENEDDSVNNCEQQKLLELFDLCVSDVHENLIWENVPRSTVNINKACGKAQRMKGNSEDRSSQSNDVQETEGAAGGDEQRSEGKQDFDQRDDVKKIAKQSPAGSKGTGNYPGAPKGPSRTDDSASLESEKEQDMDIESTCIFIPFTQIFRSDPISKSCKNVNSNYKLIDGLPSKIKTNTEETSSNESTKTETRKRTSYVMSLDKQKNNAIWVYEILNISTLPLYKKPGFIKGDETYYPVLGNKVPRINYERGHLAAAANHRWCQEAYKDTFYFSNMTPQVKILNKGLWKFLEKECRNKILIDSVNNVHVYTGPLYQTDSSKYKVVFDKVVPTHYFKVIIVENENGTVEEPECYLMPNDESKYPKESKDSKKKPTAKEKYEKNLKELSKYKKTIQEIQKISKLKFTVNNLKLIDCTKTGTWTGNQGKTTVALDITISN
ncbi:uncharacterized protein [Chanodichthys erythropterus]|uniref:uncharacterized protein n=1 Tax=Chanodichthys erythropterus TaxID=933992 RepID=UPI00351F8047